MHQTVARGPVRGSVGTREGRTQVQGGEANVRGGSAKVRAIGMEILVLFVALSLVLTPVARGDRLGASSKLTARAGQGSGLVELTMTAEEPLNADGVRTEHVQGTVEINGALPSASYRVARAVDPRDISDTGATPDGVCPALEATGPWRPFSDLLNTSAGGAGALHFEAAPPPPTRFVSGVSFDVQFQVIEVNADGSLDPSQELRSGCLTVTVK